jgi:translation initiation factor IF-1
VENQALRDALKIQMYPGDFVRVRLSGSDLEMKKYLRKILA